MTPQANLEREVKLDVGLHFALPDLNGVLPGVVATALPDAKLQATYIDTPDLRLMRWGVTLRYRRDVMTGGSGESGWTLKLPSDAEGVALVRNELSWPGRLGPVPAEVASMVRAHARTEPLGPVARLITERRRVELRDDTGRKLAELDDDVVSVMDGRRLAARFRQVELEMTDVASEVLIVEVLNRLAVAGAVAGDDRPKVVRAIGARASLGPDVVVPDLSPKATVATVVAAAIAAGLTRIIRHDPGVRLGDDPEHVHQARVGTRRLRSDLWTFRQLLDPECVRPIRAELGWLGAALGEVRDADVLTGRLRGQIRALPDIDARPAAALLRRLAVQRDEARGRMLEALNSQRYLTLLEDLARAAADPPLAQPAAASQTVDGSTNGSGAGERSQPAVSFVRLPGDGALPGGQPVGARHQGDVAGVVAREDGADFTAGVAGVDGLAGAQDGVAGADGLAGVPGGGAGVDGLVGVPGGGAGVDGLVGVPGGGAGVDGLVGAPGGGAGADGLVGAPGGGAGADGLVGAPGGGAGADGLVGAPRGEAVADGARAGEGERAGEAGGEGRGEAAPSGEAGADGVRPAMAIPAGREGLAAGGTSAAGSGPAGTGRRVTAPLSAGSSLAGVPDLVDELAPTGSAERPAAPFPIAEPLGERRAADVLPLLVNRPWKQLKRAVDALGDDPPDEALHEVRILAKRVRYAAEAVAGVVGKPARAMAAAVAEVQGVLGDMQDAVVAETWLRRHVSSSGSTAQAMVAGELVTVQRQEQEACRKGWKAPWKAASHTRLRAWIKD